MLKKYKKKWFLFLNPQSTAVIKKTFGCRLAEGHRGKRHVVSVDSCGLRLTAIKHCLFPPHAMASWQKWLLEISKIGVQMSGGSINLTVTHSRIKGNGFKL